MLASLTTLIAAIGILTPYQEPTIGAVDGLLDRASLFPGELMPVQAVPVEHDDSVPLPDRQRLGKNLPPYFTGDPNFLGLNTGRYYPPANELLDPRLELPLLSYDQRPDDFIYGCIMFSKRITRARREVLEGLGCRLLDFLPHYSLQAALPREALTEISTLPFVRWVGTIDPWQKIQPRLSQLLEGAGEGEIEVIVSLFESDLCEHSVSERSGPTWSRLGQAEQEPDPDGGPRSWQSNGWQQRSLEAIGFKVRNYNHSTNSFRGTIARQRVGDLAALNLVLFIELVTAAIPSARPDEESTPMMAMDAVRGVFDGGFNEVAVVGVCDSGIESNHQDFSGLWGVGGDCTAALDPWSDAVNHGTHVAGILFGRGVASSDLLGNQPGLGSFGGSGRVVNLRRFGNQRFDVFGNPILDGDGDPTFQPCTLTNEQVMNFWNQSFGSTPRPHVINNSWGTRRNVGDPAAIGVEDAARAIDNATYNNKQLHVFSSGNTGPAPGSVSSTAASKNALVVGSVLDHIDVGPDLGAGDDPGMISRFSSRGPCGDGRWAPKVAAPGEGILGANANNNIGYFESDGTSMAAPHVTALAASLVDHFESVRYEPALLSAIIMATAIPRDNNLPLQAPFYPMLHPTGAGCASVLAHGPTSFTGLQKSSFVVGGFGIQAPMSVPENTRRLVVVMHYIELAATSISERALVNDYDLWLTESSSGAVHTVHQDSLNNTEIAVIDDPDPGMWMWSVVPQSVTGVPVQMAVVVHAILDDPEPNATLALQIDDKFVKPGDHVRVDATVGVDGYVGASVILDRSGHAAKIESATSVLYDGLATDLTDNPSLGEDITLGDILVNGPRRASWELSYSTQGVKDITVEMRSANMATRTETVQVFVDTVAPTLPQDLTSTSHTPNQWSTSPFIDFVWQPAADSVSGLAGYSALMSIGSPQSPPKVMFLGDVTSFSPGGLSSSVQPQFFNLRPVDKAGNWGSGSANVGPFFIDAIAPDAPTFESSSHTPGVPSCDPTVYVTWSKVVDDHSGTKGYGLYWTKNPNSIPGETLGSVANFTTSNTLSPGSWYLHVRTKDIAGNWTAAADTAHLGPFVIEQCPLFEDDFESGSLFTNGWIQVNSRVRPSTSAAFTGNYGVRLRKTQTIEQDISTLGMQNVMLTLDRRAMSYEKGDPGFRISWSSGLKWKTLYSTTIDSWGTVYLYLPPEAWDSPNLRIRFQSLGNSWFDYTEIDNVRVLATSK